jgi:hypothetical protein
MSFVFQLAENGSITKLKNINVKILCFKWHCTPLTMDQNKSILSPFHLSRAILAEAGQADF